MSSQNDVQKPELADEKSDKVTIGAYISLVLACVFFSGVCATNQWWGIFDFTTINGSFGKLVSGVTQNGDALNVATANFRGKGGSGAIDGFMFALTLVPTVMFALAMITVFDHFGALKACRQILTPILRPLIGVPGGAGLALIASLQFCLHCLPLMVSLPFRSASAHVSAFCSLARFLPRTLCV